MRGGKAIVVLIILVVVLGLVTWNVLELQAYRSATFEVKLTSFEINYILLIPYEAILNFTVAVHNPSSIDIYIPRIDGNVYIEDVFIDDFQIKEKRVPAGETITQSFSITISLEDYPSLWKALYEMLLGKRFVEGVVNGTARLRLSLLPVIEIPYYISLHFSEPIAVSIKP